MITNQSQRLLDHDSGQLSDSQASVERRERLRKLALETIDISKDPYFMRNHLGSYECKLCLTLHNNEGDNLKLFHVPETSSLFDAYLELWRGNTTQTK